MHIVWIYIAMGAYLLNALAFVVDKYLLSSPIPKPFPYAFWVGILSTPVLLLIPFFDIFIESLTFFLVAILSGALFLAALVFLYKSIKKSDVSVASTQVGIITAIFTYVFSLLILGEVPVVGNAIALAFLVLGIFFLGKAGSGILKYAVVSGMSFGLSFVLLKWTFIASDFINGVFWTRIGFIGTALAFLLVPKIKKEIISSFHNAPKSSKLVFIGNKLLAGTGFVLLYFAILIGNVAVINALLGFQFLFIFLIALILKNKLHGVKESLDKKIMLNKIFGIIFVLTGFLAILI